MLVNEKILDRLWSIIVAMDRINHNAKACASVQYILLERSSRRARHVDPQSWKTDRSKGKKERPVNPNTPMSGSPSLPRTKLQNSDHHISTRNTSQPPLRTSNSRTSAAPQNMKALVCSLLLLALFAASLPPPARSFELPVLGFVDLIDQTCRLTPFYELCLSSLKSDPHSGAADVRGLARIMAGSVLASASGTLDRIQDLLARAPDPESEQSLAKCAELYIPVVKYSLPQAIDALDKGQFGFAEYGLSDAGDEAGECEKNLSGQGGSPVTEGNELVRNLVDVALAIIKVLQKSF